MNKTTYELQTVYDFTLPRGYISPDGTLHRKGKMRLATAMDEIAPMRDPRVRANQAYLVIILLARVITHLGSIEVIDTGVIENFFSADLAYLQNLYRRINELEPEDGGDEALDAPGGIIRYPSDALYEEVAYIAYHFHWPMETILTMEHAERHKWVAEISKINQRLNERE